MNCAEFEALMPDLNRRETRGKPVYEAALAHARLCDQCSKLMVETESLERGLRALAAEDLSKQAPARVEANLLREFRGTKMAAARRKVNWQAAAIGIAAAVLLVVGVAMHRWLTTQPGNVHVTQAPPAVAPAEASNPGDHTVVMKAESSVSKAPKPSGRRMRPIPTQAQAGLSEATDFITLPYADDPSTFDEGAVVRVEMPRAALASFGLPVGFAPNNDRVRADLLVAQDGTPQAIRLVSDDASNRLH